MRYLFELTLIGASFVCAAGCGSNGPSASQSDAPKADVADLATVLVDDLQGNQIPAIADGPSSVVVFLFLRTDCPISNRYAPEMQRLGEKFSAKGVRFRLVFPAASDSAAAIQEHVSEFRLPIEAVRDPTHALAQRCGVNTTPQAAVFLADGETLAYRGRIDDRYVDFGVSRPEPTTRDLEDALEAILAQRKVAVALTPAVGCPIGEPQ
jgi:hypothetical protein